MAEVVNKKIILLICLSIASISMSLGLIEFYLNLKGYKKISPWTWSTEGTIHKIDTKLIYSLNKNSFNQEKNNLYISQYGMKYDPSDYDDQKVASSNSTKIIVLGDSFVWGNTSYKETYPYLLKTLIQEQTNQSIDVLNAGVSGYGTDQEYVFLTHRILPSISPQILVWNININDIVDNIDKPLFDLQNNRLDQIEGWRNHLYMQGLASKLLSHTPIHDSSIIDLLLNSFINIKLYKLSITDDDAESWSLTKMGVIFQEVKKLCKEKNIRLIFAISPSQKYVEKLSDWENEAKIFEKIKNLIGYDAEIVDMNEAFVNFENILLTTLTPESLFLEESHQSEKGNWHPNEFGNWIMAKVISQKILGG